MLGGVVAAALSCVISFPLAAAAKPARASARKPVSTRKAAAPASKATVTRVAARKPAVKATSATRTSSAARRRAIARSRAAARAREARELATPRFKLDDAGREIPSPRAAAAIIYDPETNEVLFEEHGLELRSIASITKVMTALVALESFADANEVVTVTRPDVTRASTTYLRNGYKVSVDELLHLLLIGSDNAAARVLARVSPHGSDGFVTRMNEKARELGLTQTQFEDPSGLLSGNISSAFDIARLISYAAADERIGGVMRKAEFNFVPGKRNVHVNSTNRLVRSGELDVLGGKTGFINSSGYCLATLVRLPQTGRQVAMVVLGARSNAARFAETRHLFNWLNAASVATTAPAGLQQQ